MPNTCGVFGCSKRSNRDVGIRFFRLPADLTLKSKTKSLPTANISKIRRERWLHAIKREGLSDINLDYFRVCSNHFIEGKPAALDDDKNPDWVPSQHMGYKATLGSTLQMTNRFKRACRREEVSQPLCPALQAPMECQEDEHVVASVDVEDTFLKSVQSQTDLTSEGIGEMLLDNCHLGKQKLNFDLSEGSFQNNDAKTLYFTGLDIWPKLKILMKHTLSYIILHHNSGITKFDVVMLTLIKLRLNLDFKLLAQFYNISPTSVSTHFKKTIQLLHHILKPSIVWPSKETIYKTTPGCFKRSFHEKTTIIIDCFEVFTERPPQKDRAAQFWSNYKHHSTLKFLIGITPAGVISFISEAWGGRCSDKHITINSAFFKKLMHGDVILADRGFLIREYVSMFFANVSIPAFTKGRTQFHPIEVEETRDLANVRIHVERVIGAIRQKYKILSGKLSMSIIMEVTDEPLIDKIVTVCCALYNLCPPVVPQE